VKVVEKKVYYCDFCKKHRLSRVAMEKHERHCTRNPERICRWMRLDDPPSARMFAEVPTGHHHKMRRGLPRWIRLFAPLDSTGVDRLREHARGCPACMLSAVRLSEVDVYVAFRNGWSFEAEVERHRKDEREHWLYEERRLIEGTFL
jgi:hypothetical protein